MLVYVLCALACVLLILLYHRLHNRRVFLCFCLTLLFAGAAFYAFHPRPQAPALTAAEKQDLYEQQAIFSAWNQNYQQQVKQLDHNWQRYHQILSDFTADRISIEVANERFAQLETDERALADAIHDDAPPLELHDQLYDLVTSIQRKTSDYADAQLRTISLTRAASSPEYLVSTAQEEQAKSLTNIMEKESPAQLFTASEVLSIQKLLTIPEDTPGKTDTKGAAQ